VVSAIIVNYRTKELTAQAAQSCLLEPEIEEVVVVDNQSGDDSVEWLRSEFAGQPVSVIASSENRGFGAANNLGAEQATGEHLFLLNSDAWCLPGCARLLLSRLDEAGVGIVAPETLEDDERTVQPRNYGAFPSLRSILLRSSPAVDPASPDWVSGVAMMMRREDFLRIGGFDERFFMYLEDVDLCRHFRAEGYRIVREPEAKIVHLGGKSSRSKVSQKKQYYASQDLYLEKAGFSLLSRSLIRTLRWPAFWLSQLGGGKSDA
jgi:N-acetylglucosaminyl-diphospho-decaprenol L-rhamnosyltransferase